MNPLRSRIGVCAALGLLLGPVAPASAEVDDACRIYLEPKTTIHASEGSAVELELPITRELFMLYVDTTDGTLESFFDANGIYYSGAQEEIARAAGILAKEPAAARWRGLAYSQQRELINQVNRYLKRTERAFFADRRIHGLVARSGKHSGYPLEGHVEYRSPRDLLEWKGVELHFRLDGPPSRNLREARRFTRDLIGRATDLHVHIVAKSRWTTDRIRDPAAILRHVDFLRRTEMIAHMISVVDSEIGVAANVADDGVTHMGVLSPHALEGIVRSYAQARENTIASGSLQLPEVHTKNYVGFRSEGAYSEGDLWGTEFRVVTERGDDANFEALLDGIRLAMHDPDYGLPDSRLVAWLEAEFAAYARSARDEYVRAIATQSRVDRILRAFRLKKPIVARVDEPLMRAFVNERLPKFVTDQYPVITLKGAGGTRRIGEIEYAKLLARFDDEDPALKALWRTYLTTAARNRPLADAAKHWVPAWNDSHRHLGYVIHRWEKDALFADRPEALAKIRRARTRAIRRLNRGTSSVEATRAFLLESGIYEAYLAGFGAKLRR